MGINRGHEFDCCGYVAAKEGHNQICQGPKSGEPRERDGLPPAATHRTEPGNCEPE